MQPGVLTFYPIRGARTSPLKRSILFLLKSPAIRTCLTCCINSSNVCLESLVRIMMICGGLSEAFGNENQVFVFSRIT